MTDYANLDISNVGKDFLLQCKDLTFSQDARIVHGSGEVIEQKHRGSKVIPELRANYKNLVFEIYRNGKINLRGSHHVFWNDGKHNYNDFGVNEMLDVFHNLAKFGIDPARTKIHHIEIGLNLHNLPFESSKITNSMMFHTGQGIPLQPFKHKIQKTESDFITIEKRDSYTIKMYDKAKHYNQEGNIFRFEWKIIKGCSLSDIGINYLSDLLKPNNLDKLRDKYLKIWNGCILADWTIDETNISLQDKIRLKDWKNPKYWQKFYEENKGRSRQKFSRELKKYLDLVQGHSDNVHKIIGDKLLEKWYKVTTVNDSINNYELVQGHTNIISDLVPVQNEGANKGNKRLCVITGIDISHQKDSSKFLSEHSVKQFLDSDPESFEKLKLKFCPNYERKEIDQICYDIAHNIRNSESNFKQQIQTRKKKYSESLFPFKEIPQGMGKF